MIQTNVWKDFYIFKTATSPKAPNRYWLAKVKVGGASFEKRLKIETVMPNRLKIGLEFGGKENAGKERCDRWNTDGTWLFGATARNLKAKVEAFSYAGKTVSRAWDHFSLTNLYPLIKLRPDGI
jgi:hypothetical protein